MNDHANSDAGHGSVTVATHPSAARARLASGPATAIDGGATRRRAGAVVGGVPAPQGGDDAVHPEPEEPRRDGVGHLVAQHGHEDADDRPAREGQRRGGAVAEVLARLPTGPRDERTEEQPGAVEVDRHTRHPGEAQRPGGGRSSDMARTLREEPGILILRPAADPKRPHVTPQHRPDATADLTAALRERVLVLDGAMGTMIQAYGLSEADYRGERFADHGSDQQGNNDLLSLTQPELIREVHRKYLEAGRRPARDQHVQRAADLAGRLRHAGHRLRDERRRGLPGARRGRRHDRAHARPAALGAGHARPDEPHGIHLPRRQRPRRPQRHLRRAGRGLPRAGPRAGRRRRRRAARRDHLRHAQRQGRDLRARDALRGARPPLAGDDLRHHHRRLRAHPVRAGHRGVLVLGAARPAAGHRPELRAGRRRAAPLRRRAGAHRRLLRLGPPERRAAQRLRRVRRDARGDGPRSSASSPPPGWSTSSAAAAAPLPPHIAAIAEAVHAGHAAHAVGRSRRRCAWPGSSRASSTRAACSSTSASAPTSPGRPGSAASSRRTTTAPR